MSLRLHIHWSLTQITLTTIGKSNAFWFSHDEKSEFWFPINQREVRDLVFGFSSGSKWLSDQLPALRISSDSSIGSRRCLSVLHRQNRSEPLRFFSFFLLGFLWYLSFKIVSFSCSTKLPNEQQLSGLEPTTPRLLVTFFSASKLILIYFFAIKSNWNWRYRKKRW